MKVLISIPAYNEEKSIGNVINDINKVLSRKYDFKIQIVNDGSKDKTKEITKGLNAIVYDHPHNLGLAETFRTELDLFLQSNFDVLVHIDADGQYYAEDILRLLEKINDGYDLVLGARRLRHRKDLSIIKKFGNKAFSFTLSKITGLRILDGQTGFRAFNKEVAKLGIISNHTYTQEQIIRVSRNKLKIGQVIVNTRITRKSRLLKNPFEYAIKAWINLLRIYRDYEPLKFFGIIGLMSILLGFIFGVFILGTFLSTGKVGHLPLTLLTMLSITVGVQIILFGFLADMNRK